MKVLLSSLAILAVSSFGDFALAAAAPVVPPAPPTVQTPPRAAKWYELVGLDIQRNSTVSAGTEWERKDEGNNSLFTVNSGPREGARVEVRRSAPNTLTDIVTVLPTDGLDGDPCQRPQTSGLSGRRAPNISPEQKLRNSRFVSVTHFSAGRILSQTECLEGLCINVNDRSCYELAAATGSESYNDLVAKFQSIGSSCGDFTTKFLSALEEATKPKPGERPTPGFNSLSEANFARDLETLRNSPARQAPGVAGAVDMSTGLTPFKPNQHLRMHRRMERFVDECAVMARVNGLVPATAAPSAAAAIPAPAAAPAARRVPGAR